MDTLFMGFKMKYKDLTGQKINEWEVLYRFNNKWMCKCSCGNIKEVWAKHLKNGASKYCIKCASRLKWEKRKPDTSKSILGNLFSQILWGAKIRNIDIIDLTKENLFELFLKQESRCALSGLNIEIGINRESHKNGGTTASLDRIDSNKGYSIDNVQWVHKDINRMKMDLSKDKFIQYCIIIADNNRGK